MSVALAHPVEEEFVLVKNLSNCLFNEKTQEKKHLALRGFSQFHDRVLLTLPWLFSLFSSLFGIL